ncbi:MAG: hypothetical protein ACXVCP_04220 [Bdellovibrio sp.]
MFFFNLAIISIILMPQLGLAKLNNIRSCLTNHVHEAITLNKLRKPLYEQVSQKKSESISNKMISMEYRLLLASPLADIWAAPYQAAGIPILCQELVPMSGTPVFKPLNPNGKDSFENFHQPDIDYIREQMLSLYKARAWNSMANFADRKIVDLEQAPRYNCMVKHILESIRRVAALTPIHAQKAVARNMISTEYLSKILLKSHIDLLNEAAELDKLAAPLQADGLPIICQDVPFIPWP